MIVGIDPDIDKNGVAIKTDQGIELKSLRYFELFEFLRNEKLLIKEVVIEGGWLNQKSNFRIVNGAGANARIGKNVGANHESGRKIVEMCEYLGVPFRVVKPLKKTWGKDGKQKISHQELERVLNTKIKSSNPEQRDALLLIL